MQQYHKKSGKDLFKLGVTVPRCASHCLTFYQGTFPNINVTSQILQVRLTEGDYVYPKIRKPIGLVKKGFDMEVTVKNQFQQMLQNK